LRRYRIDEWFTIIELLEEGHADYGKPMSKQGNGCMKSPLLKKVAAIAQPMKGGDAGEAKSN
jgi:hypothetical protein